MLRAETYLVRIGFVVGCVLVAYGANDSEMVVVGTRDRGTDREMI